MTRTATGCSRLRGPSSLIGIFFVFMCVMSRLRLPLRVKKNFLSQHSETLSDPVPHTLSQPWKPLPDSSSSTSSPALHFCEQIYKISTTAAKAIPASPCRKCTTVRSTLFSADPLYKQRPLLLLPLLHSISC